MGANQVHSGRCKPLVPPGATTRQSILQPHNGTASRPPAGSKDDDGKVNPLLHSTVGAKNRKSLLVIPSVEAQSEAHPVIVAAPGQPDRPTPSRPSRSTNLISPPRAFDAPQPRPVLSTAAKPLPCDARSRASFVDGPASSAAAAPPRLLPAPPSTQPPPSARGFTRDEVRRMIEEQNRICIFIRNKVYDVTDYAAQHPGGASVLRFNCGKDATEDFESMHDAYAFGEMRKWCIGKLVDEGGKGADTALMTATQSTSSAQSRSDDERKGGSGGSASSTINKTAVVVVHDVNRGTATAPSSAAARLPATSCTLAPDELGELTVESVSRYVAASARHVVIMLFGDVYDVSDYATQHPGGLRILQNNNNKECGSLFTRIHGARARTMVAQFYVGRLQGSTLQPPASYISPRPALVAVQPTAHSDSQASSNSGDAGDAAGDAVHETRLLELRLSGVNSSIRYLTFAMPEPLRLLPGGHIRFLRDATSNEGRYYTPYCADSATFGVCIKHASPDGISHLLFSLKEGDKAYYSGPFEPKWLAERDAQLNSPTLRRAEERHVLLVGGGTGVVPLYCIAKDLLVRRFSRVTLLCSFHTSSDMVLAAELKELAMTYGPPSGETSTSDSGSAATPFLRLLVGLTRAPTAKMVRWAQETFTRRINGSVLRQAEIPKAQAAVICGPPSFADATARAVTDCAICASDCVYVL